MKKWGKEGKEDYGWRKEDSMDWWTQFVPIIIICTRNRYWILVFSLSQNSSNFQNYDRKTCLKIRAKTIASFRTSLVYGIQIQFCERDGTEKLSSLLEREWVRVREGEEAEMIVNIITISGHESSFSNDLFFQATENRDNDHMIRFNLSQKVYQNFLPESKGWRIERLQGSENENKQE